MSQTQIRTKSNSQIKSNQIRPKRAIYPGRPSASFSSPPRAFVHVFSLSCRRGVLINYASPLLEILSEMLSFTPLLLLATSASVVALPLFTNVTSQAHCSARGGCDCDCAWANPTTCAGDDGSCCHTCCCSGPAPAPSPSPASNATAYCPSANDLTVAYGGSAPQIVNQGWTISGGGAVATKSSFNLLGGYVRPRARTHCTRKHARRQAYTFAHAHAHASYCAG